MSSKETSTSGMAHWRSVECLWIQSMSI